MKRVALVTVAFWALALISANAQVFHSGGPPASVTSMTGSGMNPGIPASVTSMRPSFQSELNDSFRRHGRDFDGDGDNDRGHRVPVFIPIYPYYGYPAYYGDYNMAPAYAQPQPPAATQPQPEAPAQTVFENRPGYKAPPPEPAATAEVSAPAPSALAEKAAPEEPEPKTVLIFKDGHKLEVGNYVIVGDTLYNLSGAYRSYKIALADLDIKATIKANSDRGLEFHLPDAANKNAA